MDHIVLNAEDDEAMMDFYSTVLMMLPERLDCLSDRQDAFPVGAAEPGYDH